MRLFSKLAFLGLFSLGITSYTEAQTTNSVTNHSIPCLTQGNFSIGSRIGLATSSSTVEVNGEASTTNLSSTQVVLTPSLGYFVVDNLQLGMGMEYTLSRKKSGTDLEKDSRTLFGPFARYYLPIGDDDAFFIGLVTGFGRSNSSVEVNNQTQTLKNTITNIGIGPGYTIFSNRCFAMEAQAKYNFGYTKTDATINGNTTTSTSRSNAFDFVVGVSYYFSR